MKLTVRNTTAAFAAVATAGVSSIFMGAAPALAATDACGATGTLIAPGICELIYTSGTPTFIPTASMTKLEVLLVGAGGSGAEADLGQGSDGYAAAGGGGDVKIVNFSGATAAMNVTVATTVGATSTVTNGTTSGNVANGQDAAAGGYYGGDSGSGFVGSEGDQDERANGGGGAGASPVGDIANGGAGVIVSAIAPSGSLFAGDTNCYGGGGAAGISGVRGLPGCGGGGPLNTDATDLTNPIANSGGGGGGLNVAPLSGSRTGSDGVVVIRWTAASVLAATGGAPNPAGLPIGITALLAGATLFTFASHRKRRES